MTLSIAQPSSKRVRWAWVMATASGALLVSGAVSCSEVLGLGDPVPYSDVDADAAADDASTGDDAKANDGGAEGAVVPPPCDANLTKDSKNCGACGHDCRGAVCQGGQCLPALVAKSRALTAFTVDDSYVYFTDTVLGSATKTIERVDKAGAGRTTIAPAASGDAFIPAISVNGTFVFWSNPVAGVRACPITGCTGPALVVGADQDPRDLALFQVPGSPWPVAWLNGTSRAASYALPDGGTGILATHGLSDCSSHLAATATKLYLSDPATGRLLAIPPSGPVKPIFSTVACSFTATDDHVFYADSRNVWSAQIIAAGLAAPIAIANAQDYPFSVMVDATHVYWMAAGLSPRVLRCKRGGCNLTPEVVVRGFDALSGLALDSDYLYFATQGTNVVGDRIWRIGK